MGRVAPVDLGEMVGGGWGVGGTKGGWGGAQNVGVGDAHSKGEGAYLGREWDKAGRGVVLKFVHD